MKKFKCTICGKKFKTGGGLALHKYNVHGIGKKKAKKKAKRKVKKMVGLKRVRRNGQPTTMKKIMAKVGEINKLRQGADRLRAKADRIEKKLLAAIR